MQKTKHSSKLFFIYRFSFILYYFLSANCVNNPSADKKTEPVHLPNPCVGNKVKKRKLSEPGHTDPALNEPVPKKIKKECRVLEDQQAIVLLHGLRRISYDFNKMKEALKQRFPYATIIALKSVNKDPNKGSNSRSPSEAKSIKEQADLAYQEIKGNPSLRGKHIVIVGHSQGGLRGFTIIREYGTRLKSEVDITIDHLITIATPWKGAPVMRRILKNYKEEISAKLDREKNTLEKIQKGYTQVLIKSVLKIGPLEYIPQGFFNSIAPNLLESFWSGALDVSPTSDFIHDYVPSGLRAIKVPITAIAGVLVDFSKLFEFKPNIKLNDWKKLNETYAEITGGRRECEHDMRLPVDTQHAEGLEKNNFECIKVDGTCHGNKVGIPVKKGLPELNNKDVIESVIGIIDKVFYKEKEIEE